MNWIASTLAWACLIGTLAACCPARPEPVLPPESESEPQPQPTAMPNETPADPGPPKARREDVVDEIHGVRVADPYRWLEDGDAPEVKEWLKAHDDYARERLEAAPERDALVARLKELSYIDWVSSPRRHGDRYFFSRRHKDKEKVVYYWRQGKDGEPKVLIDPNTLSEDGSISLRGVWPSRDGKYAAYKLSENAADEATMYVMEVATGKKLETDTIAGAKYAWASWQPDGKGFYYTHLPVDDSIPIADRPGFADIRHHVLGTDPKDDRIVHEKTGDPKTFIDAHVSRDGHYLFFNKYYGWTKNDVYFMDLRRHSDWQPLAVGMEAKFDAYAWKDAIYVHTDHQAPRWRMMKVEPTKPDLANWKEIVPQHAQAVMESYSVVGDHLVLRYLDKASSRMEILTLAGKPVRSIDLPGIGSVEGPSGNPEDDNFYYAFHSYDTPTTIFESSIKKGGRETYFELEVPVDTSPYLVEQQWFTSKDGTKVSMFIVRRKDMQLNGDNPFLLNGYGGFNINYTPEFTATWFAWLERGGSLAFPNLRGGGEYGEDWHRDGMLKNKQNVFDDYIAAAEFLIANKYTRPERLAIRGGSNGGLLVGAVMTQRPELYRAVICAVPLLDMVRYHLFGSGKTWISEYGSAEDAELFPVLYGYSPYHHVKEGVDYPALLMLTADSDDRVDPLHARKFVAALRHANTGKHPVLLRMETNAGHGGGDLIKKAVERQADSFVFLLDELRVGKPLEAAP